MAALGLLLALAAQVSVGYRLEGQIFDEQELELATSLRRTAGSDAAFSHSSGGHGQGLAKNATGEEEEEQECQLAVSGSSKKKRGQRCQCPDDTMVKCADEPCNKYGRSFRSKALAGKSCRCSTCDVRCESVPGAKTRSSKWKFVTGRDCECEEGFFLVGSNKNCRAKGKDNRFFKARRTIDRDCSCSMHIPEDWQKENATAGQDQNQPSRKDGLAGDANDTWTPEENATSGHNQNQSSSMDGTDDEQVVVPGEGQKENTTAGQDQNQTSGTDGLTNDMIEPWTPEEPKAALPWYRHPAELSKNMIYGLCSLLCICCLLTTVIRFFKAAREDDNEEDVGKAGSEKSDGSVASETWHDWRGQSAGRA